MGVQVQILNDFEAVEQINEIQMLSATDGEYRYIAYRHEDNTVDVYENGMLWDTCEEVSSEAAYLTI